LLFLCTNLSNSSTFLIGCKTDGNVRLTKQRKSEARDLSHVSIGKRSLNILRRKTSNVLLQALPTRKIPVYGRIRNMVSHIKQYEFAATYFKNGTVLDAACGTGYGSEILRYNNNVVVGLDIRSENVKFAKKNYPYNTYFVGNVEDLSRFNDSTFDAIVSIQTIEHLWHPKKAIEDFHRILKDNGQLLGAIPVNCKHEMCSQSKAPNRYFFCDCKRLLFPTFKHVTWFFHDIKTNGFASVTEDFLKLLKTHCGDFVFIAKK